MQAEIKTLKKKILLVGKSLSMSFANNQTPALWQSFMPQRNTIQNTVGEELFSVQFYSKGFFDALNPQAPFEKWACREVSSFENIPQGMKTLTITSGLYAVFHYVGHPAEAPKVYQYIFGEWLPQSGYTLDQRAHFEILGEKYDNNSPLSEEDIWIPIKK